MYLPDITPEYIEVFWFPVSQTLITSLVATVFFVLFVVLYNLLKSKNPKNKFVVWVDMFVELVLDFFENIGGTLHPIAKNYVIFVFFYLLWVNLFWVLWDVFAIVIPAVHEWFRPVATDIYFNAILAVLWVVGSLIYWFKMNGFHYIEKFVPYKWMGLVDKVDSVWKFFVKIADIAIGLFVWVLEMISEVAKILSLTLRLFWNIFAWVILLTLSITALPVLFPVLVIVFEIAVSFIQAFVFALLVCIYFKMAESVH